MVGRRSPQSPSISRLTSPPDRISASLTPYVPKYAIEPDNKSLASSEVAVAGVLDAIFGRSGRANMRKKRPFASKTTMPFGLVPYDWSLLPFGSACSQEPSVQVPTSWSLIDHCWLIALLGNAVSPNIMIAEILRTRRRFMFPSSRC